MNSKKPRPKAPQAGPPKGGESMPAEPANSQVDELRAQVSKMLQAMNPADPIGATVDFKVNRQKEREFEGRAAELASATRKLPGCRFFEYVKRKAIDPQPHDSPS